jgi:hypothetical protein
MYVIGNGESRKGINLSNLRPLIGCNAIIRDFNVDHCVCVDRRMTDEVVNMSYTSKIYTRKNWLNNYRKYNNVYPVPDLPYVGDQRWDEPMQWGSGPYAVLLAAMLSDARVNLIGFDLYSNDKFVNNIYKNTKNYDSGEKRSVDPRYWIHQIGMVFKTFNNINFTIYNHENWSLPNKWIYSNVTLDKIQTLM